MIDEQLYGTDLFGESLAPRPESPVAQKFLVPPFTVLNAREGDWQDRKRAWIACGIKGEVGRGENLLSISSTVAREFGAAMQNTSIFDPVICELAYRWFSALGHQVLDPFAGGSVRGIVAGMLGRKYWGGELRGEQVAANCVQADEIRPEIMPEWKQGDSARTLDDAPPADFLFSCPPYGDLEVYSDDPQDLSAMDWPAFLEAYRAIIAKACAKLKQDRFACFVVGDFRDKRGNYRNFPAETIRAFLDAGLTLYNEAILVTSVGSACMRVTKQFEASRKFAKTHQNVFVFLKGDAKKAAEAVR